MVGDVGGEGFFNLTEKHVLIVAGTRGGKGRDLIIPNLWIYKGSVFVLDPKGENAQRTQENRQKFGPVWRLTLSASPVSPRRGSIRCGIWRGTP
jgi:type IV secretory pathway TraG/TraD family ATPase VirD4